MVHIDQSASESIAGEVAGELAKGLTPPQIISKFDLSPVEFQEIVGSKAFELALAALGSNVVAEWKEFQAESSGTSVRRRIANKLDAYYDQLDKLATNKELKPEKRADILLALMRIAAPPDQAVAPSVRMPPSLLDNWARRHVDYEIEITARREAALRVGNPQGSPKEK